MYKQIKVTTKDGKECIEKHSDYYILDEFVKNENFKYSQRQKQGV